MVAGTDAQARGRAVAGLQGDARTAIGGSSAGWPPMQRAEFDREGRSWIAVCRIAGNGGAQDRRHGEGAEAFPDLT